MPRRLHRFEKTARAFRIRTVGFVFGVVVLFAPVAGAQTVAPNIARLDRFAQRARNLGAAPGFDRARLYGAARNLSAFADRWNALRARLATPDTSEQDSDRASPR